MRKKAAVVRAITDLKPGAHLCQIYETQEELRGLLTPYLAQGLRRKEKVLCIADAHLAETVQGYLKDAGCDPKPYLDSGQFAILTSHESYARDGGFNPERMIGLLRSETEKAVQEGYAALRVTGEMSWALDGLPGSERLMEYEAKLNDFFPGSRAMALCQYDKSRFAPELLLDALNTHPLAVIGTEIIANPLYVPPRDFLGPDAARARLEHWIRNLLEHKRSQEALLASEVRYRRLFEASQDGVLILDSRTAEIMDANRFLTELLGYSHGELLGKRLWDIGPFRDSEASRAAFESLQDRSYIRYDDLPLQTKDGRRINVEFVSNVYLSDGRPMIQCNIRDISQRKQAQEQLALTEAQLRLAQKMEVVGRLAGGIAHDFNNLLTAISGYCEFLLASFRRNDPRRADVEEIQKAGARAAVLTRDLLTISRRQVLRFEVLDLNALLAETRERLARLIGADIELAIVPCGAPARVRVDRRHMEQAIASLVVNARDAMPQGGKLTIGIDLLRLEEAYAGMHGTVPPGSYVRLCVVDTGCGMSAETQHHLFEPFFTTKERGKGTGLGLPTVYGIFTQSGGHVAVSSEAGKGTSFKVYLPEVRDDARRREPAAPSVKSFQGRATILLVEDELLVHNLTRRILVGDGFKVLGAGSGEEALALCKRRKSPIHLMLTDVVLPEMNGLDLAARLRVLRPEMKVIFMSGYTGQAALAQGALEPGKTFIQKPFSPSALLEAVRRALAAGAGG